MLLIHLIDISEGSVATHLGFGGIFSDSIINLFQIFFWFRCWNNFENRLIFGKAKKYKIMVPNFVGHPVVLENF